MNEERLVEIEIKIARQEDLVETLNQLVYQQQKKIAELEAMCAALARHLRDMSGQGSEAGAPHEKPPHY
jgi:SlyX protein